MQRALPREVCAHVVGALLLSPAGTWAADLPTAPADLDPPADWSFQVRIAEPATARAVRQALAGAYDRLSDDRCAAVVEDFADETGIPLSAHLDEVASSPREALKKIFIYDGSSRNACVSDPNTQATTEPGSRVVLICGLRFFERHISKPARSEIWMIHEMLHTLGLGENPPSSREITRAVMKRCLDLD